MPIQINEENGGQRLVIHVSGKLEKRIMNTFVHKVSEGHKILFSKDDY